MRLIGRSDLVAWEIDLQDLRELRLAAVECGLLDRFRWSHGLLRNHL